MSRHLTENAVEIAILQKNLKDLQAKLETAHEKILELIKVHDIRSEEIQKERQLLLELEAEYKTKQVETSDLIEKQIEDWPDVVDSKGKKRRMSSKFEDIQPGEWD
tara:strand:- start:313 stop:630 length:318 start_codon:yes stop_codon:yes gene_type:complete